MRELLGAGAPRDRVSYRNLRCLEALDGGVEDVTGYIRYSIDGSHEDAVEKGIQMVDKEVEE